VPARKGALVTVTCEVRDVDRQARFLGEGLGAVERGPGFRIGTTVMELTENRAASPASAVWSWGFNYVVAFVDDIVAAHRGLIGRGAQHAAPPTRLVDRCVFSWLRDPGVNWLELVQPAALGALPPDVTPIDWRWQEITAWGETGEPFG
jgi:hypothetical protein